LTDYSGRSPGFLNDTLEGSASLGSLVDGLDEFNREEGRKMLRSTGDERERRKRMLSSEKSRGERSKRRKRSAQLDPISCSAFQLSCDLLVLTVKYLPVLYAG